jgi:phosphate transport system protein
MSRVHYLRELETARDNMLQMGETTLALLDLALAAILKPEPQCAEQARELESQTDDQNRHIHDQCLNLITLQAPVARDARLVTGIIEAIVDLELIADYAAEITNLSLSKSRRPSSQILTQIAEAGGRIRSMLSAALKSWRTDDGGQGPAVRSREVTARAECQVLYDKLAALLSGPGDGSAYINLLFICRHLERIARHSVTIAEQATAAVPSGRVAES